MGGKINNINGIECADTRASHTIAGEELYRLLRKQGTAFENTIMKETLGPGIPQKTESSKAQVEIEIEGRIFLIILLTFQILNFDNLFCCSNVLSNVFIFIF